MVQTERGFQVIAPSISSNGDGCACVRVYLEPQKLPKRAERAPAPVHCNGVFKFRALIQMCQIL